MLRTIIIDNEKPASKHLSAMLDRHCRQSVHFTGSFATVDDGLRGIESLQPQLVFLNTAINGKTGFDLLQQLPDKNFEVIFVSTDERDAMKAFKFNPIDYLLKPIDPQGLIHAVQRVTAKKPADTLSRKFEHLLGNIEQLKQYTPPKKIMVPTINGFELLPVIDILRCQCNINYTTIFIKDKQKLVVAKTLKEFEEMLREYNFFRLHNSHLVNLAYVKSYNKGKGGSVVLNDGTEIEVSTRRKDDFLQKMATM
jgi:two-component system LytT family response regulator